MDLPVGIIGGHRIYNFYQTIHKKKIVNGLIKYTSLNPNIFSWIWKDKFLKESICSSEMARINYSFDSLENVNDGEKMPTQEIILNKFRNANIKYVIIHKKLVEEINKYEKYTPPAGENRNCQKLEENINYLFKNQQSVFEDELIKVFSI